MFAICVVSLSWLCWFSTAFIFHQLDDYSSEYLGKDILDKYGLVLFKQPVFVIVAYDENGNVRWENFFGLMVMSSLLGNQYGIMIYCAIVMSMKMQTKLSVLSEKLQKVHRQFYHVLILQITTPTLTLFLPVFALYFVPYLNIEISFPTGTILCTFALYPALDLLIMVYIASYYNQALKGIL
ncbi:hypothetical protein B9Z55_017606 [Caenorhabditis nigoni]|uniref:7TM GPCR serpentine receptor class x (Srx) domain-containing protein n=1 Tax=Caenorhabditis nigoni TaxID=1611254 RepID=A0A2G5TAB9_9PELO|nr:hypothetical protein B9Z55_017606 [Caenorhabditis nigoni]